jgi:hypothetical protein
MTRAATAMTSAPSSAASRPERVRGRDVRGGGRGPFRRPAQGYGHRQAGTAETVIAVVLLGALALTWAPSSPWPRRAAVGGQAFAILGVLVGLFTIAVGVGPRTVPDVAYHVGILAVLVVGLAVALRDGTPSPGARTSPFGGST